MADARLKLAAGLAAVLLGCGGGAERAEPAAPRAPTAHGVEPPPARAPAHPDLPDGRWASVVSGRHSLELSVPDPSSWFVDDATTQWLVLRHAATRSELVARSWKAPRRVTREECESQARLWRPGIPQPTPETTLERRDVQAPVGFHTDLRLGVQPLQQGGELQAFVLAFGAATGRCFALVYTTSAAGVGADAALGKRLAVVADAIVPRVRFREIDERVR